MEALGAAASVLTIVEVAAKKLLQDQNRARLETSQSLQLRGALDSTHLQLAHVAARLEDKLDGDNKDGRRGRRAKAMRSLGLRLRALEWPLESRELENIIESLRRDQNAFCSALHIDLATQVLNINYNIDLTKLPVARGAAFNSQANEHEPRCHPDTRVSVLADVFKWAEDPCGKSIFWLCGMAGTGKSTISRTLAAHFSEEKIPHVSFFFKKGEGDRGTAAMFFTTIACQLVHQLPCLASHVRDAIDRDPVIADKAKKEQFEKLILEPLEECKDHPHLPPRILVLIDALDECDREDDARYIVHLLSRAKEVTSVRLRCFITSRPELSIRLGFKDIGDSYTDLALHEIPKPDIERDISIYLRFRLARIRDTFNQTVVAGSRLPTDWPSSTNIQRLVEMAVPLFVFASTACRFIADLDCGDPGEQLDKILEYHDTDELSQLHTTYLPILSQLLLKRTDSGLKSRTENEKASIVACFREIVGAIVVLVDPLPTSSLSQLLRISERRVSSRLAGLHSVLHIPRDPHAPVKLLHLSFRDFLVDRKNRDANPFWVDEQETHAKLAVHCLQLLSAGGNLRRDICSLRMPGKPRSEVEPRVIDACLPPEVQYACLHWVYHLNHSRRVLRDGDEVHRFLVRHLLHWLEALSLLGRISGSIGMVDDLLGLLHSENSSTLLTFLQDARRLILSNCSAVDAYPLQIYHSAIIFAPELSEVRKTFEDQTPSWLSLSPKVDRNRDASLQAFEGHKHGVGSVAFSPDGRLLASASNEIKLWDVATGVCILTLNGGGDWLSSIAFSPDSSRLASASCDPESTVPGSIKLWDVVTGSRIRSFHGHNSCVNSVAFSPDARWLASASGHYEVHPASDDDRTVKLWDVATGHNIRTFNGHNDMVSTVVFSPDGSRLASASDEGVKLWDVVTGNCITTFEGSRSVAFSPDGNWLASAPDCTIKLWDVVTSRVIATFDDHHRDAVWCIAFSPDGSQLASASCDETIRLWDVAIGSAITTLDHYGNDSTVAFSPDCRRLASSSENIIKIWDLTVSTHIAAPDSNNHNRVREVVFSPGRNWLASASDNGTVKLWDTATGNHVKTLINGHLIGGIAFSPDGSLLAFASYGPPMNINIWETATGKSIATLYGRRFVVFSPDGRRLASGSDDYKSIKLWDSATGRKVMTFEGHDHPVNGVAFSPDGSRLVSAPNGGRLRVWDNITGTCIRVFHDRLTLASVFSVAFSPDGSWVASASGDWVSVRIWDVTTGSCIATLDVGRTILNVAFDTTGSLLNTDIGAFVLNLPPSTQAITTVAALGPLPQVADRQGIGLSPDKTWIIWDSHKILWLPPAYRPRASTVAASTVAIGCTSGRVILISFSSIDRLLSFYTNEGP
ncbi:hypothetical protein DL765_002706 [Monosporascus sp. GIB2]|nr:hypothetical protein DL765_002706 [Monosporascus sp. GIB2]